MGDIKEIFEALITRVRSPLFGYFSLSFFVTNWKAIFYLLFADVDLISCFEYFEANTYINSLLWIPLGISILVALVYPWIQYVFIYATSFPINRRNKINAKAESDLLLVKIDLENKRNELIRQKELQIIEKAKIDESIENIGSEEAREKVKKEIQSIRSEEEILRLPINEYSLDKYLIKRFPNLPIDAQVKQLFLRDVDLNKYKSMKDIDEILDKSTGFIEFYKNKNPEVFKSSIDYITKSFGFMDSDFRKKHGFAKETLMAMESYDRA